MSALNIYNSTASTRDTFISGLTSFLTDASNGCMEISTTSVSPTNVSDMHKNKITLPYSSGAFSVSTLKFSNFVSSEDKYNLYIFAGYSGTSTSGYTHSIVCLPVCRDITSTNRTYATALYNDENNVYTELRLAKTVNASGAISDLFSNFRAMTYSNNDTKFVSLGNTGNSITLSTHKFISVDNPEDTKIMLIVTDKNGYASLYDDCVATPFYVDPTYHNGKNIGFTNSINAYKYTVRGYYCDSLYYFDGGYTMPEEGISTIGGIKFLKIGSGNLFLKLE